MRVDEALLRELHDGLEKARSSIGIDGQVQLESLMRFPDVVKVEVPQRQFDDDAFAEVAACLDTAMHELDRARSAEGAILVTDIVDRVTRLEELVALAAASSAGEIFGFNCLGPTGTAETILKIVDVRFSPWNGFLPVSNS